MNNEELVSLASEIATKYTFDKVRMTATQMRDIVIRDYGLSFETELSAGDYKQLVTMVNREWGY
jgi:hypothetical protein